jgi:hypothetical protein
MTRLAWAGAGAKVLHLVDLDTLIDPDGLAGAAPPTAMPLCNVVRRQRPVPVPVDGRPLHRAVPSKQCERCLAAAQAAREDAQRPRG